MNRSQKDLARYRSVAGDGAVSAQQIEGSEFQVRELEADVRQIRAELAGAEALIQKIIEGNRNSETMDGKAQVTSMWSGYRQSLPV